VCGWVGGAGGFSLHVRGHFTRIRISMMPGCVWVYHHSSFSSIYSSTHSCFPLYCLPTHPHHLYPTPPRQLVAGFVRRVEAAWGHRFPPGYTPGLRFMAHLNEPLRVNHKPLVSVCVCIWEEGRAGFIYLNYSAAVC
jgi:hypothetical protein